MKDHKTSASDLLTDTTQKRRLKQLQNTLTATIALTFVAFACTSAWAQHDATPDPCAPLPGSNYWSADELVYAENVKQMLRRTGGFPPPAPGALSSKYESCRRERDDTTAYNAHMVLASYESLSGLVNGTMKLGASTLKLLAPESGLERWLTNKALGWSSGSLGKYFNGDAATEIEGLLTNMLAQEAKNNPSATTEDVLVIVERVKTKLKSDLGYSHLEPATIRMLDSAAVAAAARFMEAKRQGDAPSHNTSTVQDSSKDITGKERIKRFESDMRARSKRTADTYVVTGKAAEAVGDHVKASSPSWLDWAHLRDKRGELAKKLGVEEADALLAKASQNQESIKSLADSLGISTKEAKALADDAQRRVGLKEISKSVKSSFKVASEMATLANNVGWADGAASFASVAVAAESFGAMVDTLASLVGPPTPLQGLQMANSMFILAGSLSSAFGQKVSADDGLGKAIRQIIAGLQAINDQLAQMRKEQREHFAYTERNLEVLVELAASEQWAGLNSCRAAIAQLAAYTAKTGDVDLRKALSNSTYPDEDARTCAKWLIDSNSSPINVDGQDVNAVYKQLVSVAAQIAESHTPSIAALKNQNFAEAELAYPALRGLLDDQQAVNLLGTRVRWSDPVLSVSDIGQRLKSAGRVVGEDWTVRDLTRQMLNTPSVIHAAQATVVLRPAASILLPDYSGVSAQDQADRKHVNFRNNVLGAHFAIALVAMAQENLLSGAVLAEHIDVLLDEADQRDELLAIVNCRASAPVPTCMMRAGLQQLPEITGCQRLDTDPIDKCLPCPEAPNSSASTMCAKFGKKAFDERVAAARTSVLTFATLRQNVLGARMWRLADRVGHHESWMPRYAWAMQYIEAGDQEDVQAKVRSKAVGQAALKRLFPRLQIRTLDKTELPDDALIDGYIKTGNYFARLAGQCDGITDRAQLGIAACKGGKCEFVVDRTDQGRLHLRKSDKGDWRKDGDRSKEACVMAALPESHAFENGLLWQTEAVERLRTLVDRMVTMLSFETAYDQLDRPSQKWRLLEAREAQMQMQTFLNIEGGNNDH